MYSVANGSLDTSAIIISSYFFYYYLLRSNTSNVPFTFAGGIILSYLYLCKQPLSWSSTMYGVFVFYGLTVTAIGQVVLVPIFRQRLNMRETSILLCAIVSAAMGMALFAFSTRTWIVFLGEINRPFSNPFIGTGRCEEIIQR